MFLVQKPPVLDRPAAIDSLRHYTCARRRRASHPRTGHRQAPKARENRAACSRSETQLSPEVGASTLSRALVGRTAAALAGSLCCQVRWQALGVSGYDVARVLNQLVPRLPDNKVDYVIISVGGERHHWPDDAPEVAQKFRPPAGSITPPLTECSHRGRRHAAFAWLPFTTATAACWFLGCVPAHLRKSRRNSCPGARMYNMSRLNLTWTQSDSQVTAIIRPRTVTRPSAKVWLKVCCEIGALAIPVSGGLCQESLSIDLHRARD